MTPIPDPVNPILVALDVRSTDEAVRLASQVAPFVGGFKVGLELVNAAGFDIFARLQDAGATRIFYDAKFHDIPNTVSGAVRAAAKRDVWMVNIHACGGTAMMEAAREAADSVPHPPLLIGVTVLTSLDERSLNETGIPGQVASQVERLSLLAKKAKLDGVVASPQEASLIRDVCGPDFVTVIPGIRPAGTDAQDQKRIATPAQAIKAGAHYLVLGRAITGANDPAAAAQTIAREAISALPGDQRKEPCDEQ
jgi:orotidine-5'-phosphate decarboxylase